MVLPVTRKCPTPSAMVSYLSTLVRWPRFRGIRDLVEGGVGPHEWLIVNDCSFSLGRR